MSRHLGRFSGKFPESLYVDGHLSRILIDRARAGGSTAVLMGLRVSSLTSPAVTAEASLYGKHGVGFDEEIQSELVRCDRPDGQFRIQSVRRGGVDRLHPASLRGQNLRRQRLRPATHRTGLRRLPSEPDQCDERSPSSAAGRAWQSGRGIATT
jgi:hypothetical protein